MRRTVLEKRNSKSSGLWTKRLPGRRPRPRFAVCITDREPDLELRKVYQVVPDRAAAGNNYVRVRDDSGEDYLYPAEYFVSIHIPPEAERAVTGRNANSSTP